MTCNKYDLSKLGFYTKFPLFLCRHQPARRSDPDKSIDICFLVLFQDLNAPMGKKVDPTISL